MQTLQEAWTLYEQKDYEKVIEYINELLGAIKGFDIDNPNGTLLDNDSLEAVYLKGLILSDHSDDNCVQLLQLIPPTHNRYGEAMFLLALYHVKEWQDYEKSIEYLDLVPPTSPKYWQAIASKGFSLLYNEKPEEALAILATIPSNNELYGNALFTMANIYNQLDDENKADECYNKIPSTDKAYGKMLINQSMKLEGEGKIDECLAYLAKMPVDDPYYLRSLKDRSTILRENNRAEEVYGIWESMPEHSQYYHSARIIGLADAYQMDKQYDKALAVLASMVPLVHTEYLTVLDMSAYIYKQLGNEALHLKFTKWKQILEMSWEMSGIVDSYVTSEETTSEEELEFWQSIPPTTPEYYYAVLEQVILYAFEIEDNAKAKALYAQIPKEEAARLNSKYGYDLAKIEKKINS